MKEAYLNKFNPSSTAFGLGLYNKDSQSLEYISLCIVLSLPEFLNTKDAIGSFPFAPLLGYFNLILDTNLFSAISGFSLTVLINSLGKSTMNLFLFSIPVCTLPALSI